MKHPIYKDRDNNLLRTKIKDVELDKKNTQELLEECTELFFSDISGKDYIKDSSQALIMDLLIEVAIERNGLVLINAKNDDWENPVSEKTLSKIKISSFGMPFNAGAILLDNELLKFAIFGDSFVLSKNEEFGTVSVSISTEISLDLAIELGNISEKNQRLVYSALSALLYISTFKGTNKIKEKTVKNKKQDKKAGTPAHSISVIDLTRVSDVFEGNENKHSSRNKSTKSWIVRGHWRNQWYSKEGVNRPKWIEPFFKGDGRDAVQKIYKI